MILSGLDFDLHTLLTNAAAATCVWGRQEQEGGKKCQRRGKNR